MYLIPVGDSDGDVSVSVGGWEVLKVIKCVCMGNVVVWWVSGVGILSMPC